MLLTETLAVTDSTTNTILIVVGILAIIALLMWILGRR